MFGIKHLLTMAQLNDLQDKAAAQFPPHLQLGVRTPINWKDPFDGTMQIKFSFYGSAVELFNDNKFQETFGRVIRRELDDLRNWKEHATHENGDYMNTCCNESCKQSFIGHKRAFLCRLCYYQEKEKNPERQSRDA